MQHKINTNLEHIIAKIDNDFNPDNSDWIPRVGAWCIDAMSQLNVTPTKRKKKKLVVKDRIAYSECAINNQKIKVFDINGCEIKEADDANSVCGCFSTGEYANEMSVSNSAITNNIDRVNTGNKRLGETIVETVNDKYPYRYNVYQHVLEENNIQERNYVLIDCSKIELNFDTDYIYVETEYIETVCSEMFGCELPVIPNNGLLIEAIAYYCIYKMLCRGYKHPVFNLAASQYGTNPFYIWNDLKEQAKRSVINNSIDDADLGSKLFRSTLFIDTFDPRK